MPRTYKAKPKRHWSSAGLQDALTERLEANTSIRKLSKKYSIPRESLRRHITYQAKGLTAGKQGRKPIFNDAETKELRQCIVDLATLGFAMTLKSVAELVESYVRENDIQRAKKIFKYKGRIGYPGPDWINAFLKNNNLSLKDATKLCVARFNATKNPFIIYNYYDMLKKVIDELGIADRPDLIWNCDESGLPHEPKKCKVISARGQKTLQIVPGSERENTTVMAACSASGKALPPMVVFQGMQVQSTWRPVLPPDSQYYPWIYCNSSGWMDSSTFYKWFEKFEQDTRSYEEVYKRNIMFF